MNCDYPIGLTNHYRGIYSRCERCDQTLAGSIHRGMIVIYRMNRKRSSPFLCIRCITRNQGAKYSVTEEQINNFVNSHLVIS